MRPSSPASRSIELDILLNLLAETGSQHLEFTQRQLEIFTENEVRFDWLSKKFMVSFFAQGEDVKEKADLERNLNEILKITAEANITLAKPQGWNPQNVAELDQAFVAYSPRRIIFDGYSKERDFIDIMLSVLNACLMDSFVRRTLFTGAKGGERAFHTLDSKQSKVKAGAVYARDDFVGLRGIIYQPHPAIVKCYQEKRKDSPDDLLTISGIHDASAADLRDDGAVNFAYAPFMLEGGNIIIGKNKKGEDVIIIAPSDREFEEDGSFKGGFFVEDDGSVSRNSYEVFCQKVSNWCASKGYHTIIIERNLEEYSLREVYHTDVLVGLTDDGTLIAPTVEKDKKKPPISTKSLRELEDFFGKENMLICSTRDRQNLATNFIQIGNIVLLSSPDISKSFVRQLNERGLCVAIPPRRMSIMGDDGIRCHTNLRTLDKPEFRRLSRFPLETDAYSAKQTEKSSNSIGSPTSPAAKRMKENIFTQDNR